MRGGSRHWFPIALPKPMEARSSARRSGLNFDSTSGSGLKFLELCRSNRFEDVSLNQWLALTPAQLVKSHLGLDQSTIDGLDKAKKIIV